MDKGTCIEKNKELYELDILAQVMGYDFSEEELSRIMGYGVQKQETRKMSLVFRPIVSSAERLAEYLEGQVEVEADPNGTFNGRVVVSGEHLMVHRVTDCPCRDDLIFIMENADIINIVNDEENPSIVRLEATVHRIYEPVESELPLVTFDGNHKSYA